MITIYGLPELFAKLAAVQTVGLAGAETAKTLLSEDVAGNARSKVAVDTGETRESIEVFEEGVRAGGAAPFLEFGTFKMAAQPFMRPAADEADGEAALEPVKRTIQALG
jgi:HK97 gp10 family phage protein